MKRIVITGATSFLGRSVIEGLIKDGYYIYALCRPDSSSLKLLPQSENLEIIYGTLSDMDIALTSYIINEADVFIHFAWDGSGRLGRADEAVQNKNAEYAVTALEIAKKLGCTKFIFPGSQAEYGVRQDVMKETDYCEPVSAYGKAKLLFQELAERKVDLSDIALIHLRIFSIFGYGDRAGTLVDSCIDTFNSENSIELGPCNQYWNFLYIDDFVDIVRRFIEKEISSGIYNVASNDTRLLREFVDDIWKVSKKSGNYIYGTDGFNPEGTPNLQPDISRMMTELGDFTFTSFKSGISEIMQKKGL
ncbi:MAG: NAD(P)-dependent oxidoreductase [Agathobacter sp.]|nr:NAD(P)-dependent oxidoreductase [Agathobacter sp.]